MAVYRITADGFENVTAKARGRRGPARGALPGRLRRAGRQRPLARRPLLRGSDVSRRDREVPGDHARRLQAGDRRPVRQAGARARSPTSRTSGPPADCPGPTTCPPNSRSAGATRCWITCPSLIRPVGDWKQVRHDYFQVLLEQFIEHWGKPYYDYCEKLGIAFTGHYWDHEWPNCLGVPDNMAMTPGSTSRASTA